MTSSENPKLPNLYKCSKFIEKFNNYTHLNLNLKSVKQLMVSKVGRKKYLGIFCCLPLRTRRVITMGKERLCPPPPLKIKKICSL